jgi:hypothetical protein
LVSISHLHRVIPVLGGHAQVLAEVKVPDLASQVPAELYEIVRDRSPVWIEQLELAA